MSLIVRPASQTSCEPASTVNDDNATAMLAVDMRTAVNRVAIGSRNAVLLTDEKDMQCVVESNTAARAGYSGSGATIL